jgi:hypothetical protein
MERENPCRGIETELTALFQGELTAERRAEVEEHLAGCASCRTARDGIRSVFSAAAEIEDLAPSLRFKRSMEGLLARERALEPEGEGLLFRLRSAFAFILYRARVSPRFRLATISVGVHAVLLLLVSFYVLPRFAEPPTPVVLIDPDTGFTPAEDPARPEIARGPGDPGMDVPSEHPLPDERVVRNVPHATLPSTFPLQPPEQPVSYPRYTGLLTGGILTATNKERRLAALSLDGDAMLDAIEKSVNWLAASQEEDGSWAPAERNPNYRVGVSATVLLAFLSDGHSQTRGVPEHREVVRRGVRYLLDGQVKVGALRGLIGPAKGHYTYNHALATLALLESWSIDRRRLEPEESRELRIAIGDAVAFIVKTQTPQGGWRYQAPRPGSADSDTSVSIFKMMALSGARRAGFEAPGVVFDRFTDWLKRVTCENGIVGYQRRGDRDQDPRTLTAGALFLEELLGLAAPLRDRQAKLVLKDLAAADGPAANDGLLRFYSAHAFRLRGRSVLELFAPAMLEAQNPDGSWSAAKDRHAVHAGDAFLTALNTLTLTSAYRIAG